MNPRIMELARRVVGKHRSDVGSVSLVDEQIEKFAELLIRECANKQLSLASNYEVSATGYEPAFPEFVEGTVNGLREGAELIKQHFGVEE